VAEDGDNRRDEVKARLRGGLLTVLEATSFRDLRIESIAEAADLSRSAFYFYYRDKRDILMDAAAGVSEALYNEADRWWHGEGSPEEIVRGALGDVSRHWTENAVLLRTVTEVSTYDEGVRRFWRDMIGRFVAATADHIQREQEAGRISPMIDARLTSEQMIWGAERSFYIFGLTGDRDPAEISAAIGNYWLAALYGADREAAST
jgi:TetR/AcrR family transcriptional regulator, ethionamide resistance regulator